MFRRRPSIRLIVPLALVVPLVGFAAALISLSVLTSHRIAEGLGEQFVRSATGRVQRELRGYMAAAMQMSDLYARRIESGRLPLDNPEAWADDLLDDIVTEPMVASICFGWASGDAVWLLRSHNGLELGYAWSDRDQGAIEMVVDPTRRNPPTPLRAYTYDPRVRPWYIAALEANRPVWAPIYHWFGEIGTDTETGTGYARPIHDAGGGLLGVLVIDITLGGVSDYLRNLPLAEHGQVFLVDEHDMIVAASHGPVNAPSGSRLHLGESTEDAAIIVAEHWRDQPDSRHVEEFAVDLATGRARVAATSFGTYPGLDWTIVIVLPEAAFLANAAALQHRSVLIAIIATFGAVLLGLVVARGLTRPIVKLREHTRRIGGGDYNSPLSLPAASEFVALAADLNRMARYLDERGRLKQSLALATEVQQSLLPDAAPLMNGLDVEGESRYCESTGGDYFDFIDLSSRHPGRLMVAVGDVMGHGIAAALLMATARGAVRARTTDHESIGELLCRVNSVLAAGATHGRFMTMSIVEVDRPARSITWANAGHGEPLVYLPDEDRFLDLFGGGMPLGISAKAGYEQYEVSNLPDGAIIFMCTDGVWEARNRNNDEFGVERIRSIIRANAHRSAQEIAAVLRSELDSFVGTRQITDDVTFLITRIVPERVQVDEQHAAINTPGAAVA